MRTPQRRAPECFSGGLPDDVVAIGGVALLPGVSIATGGNQRWDCRQRGRVHGGESQRGHLKGQDTLNSDMEEKTPESEQQLIHHGASVEIVFPFWN